MNMPEQLSALCIRLAITLAHFLWHGAAVALAAGLAGLALRKAAPAVRYRVLLGALAIMAACPVVTLLLVPAPAIANRSAASPAPALPPYGAAPVAPQPRPIVLQPGPSRDAGPHDTPLPAAGVVEAPPAPLPTQEPPAESLWQWLSPYAAGAYAFGVLAMLARLLAGLHGGRRLRRDSEPATDPALLAMLARKARALGLRLTPAIACCGRVAVPIVVGLVRPMILLPLSMSAGLSPGQVEAVLAHELAHIRRLDPLVNVVQRLIESLLFYHPGVWFISRRIRVERENCCDDLAVAAGAERLAYAESLLHIAQRSLAESRAARGRAAVGVGATDKPSLLRTRIRRLLGGPEEPVRLGRTWPLTALLIAAVLTGTALLNLRAETGGIADPNASAPAAKDRPPATKPAQPGEFIHRVYDVRDLIVPVPDFPGPEYWDMFDPNAVKGSPADKQRAQWRAAEAKKLMDRLIEQIKGIAPESWKDEGPAEKRGNIQLLNGVLVISQTRANHGRIEKLIAALRSKKSMQVLVATRFINGLSVPAGAKDDALSAWLGKNVKARLDEKTGLLPLSADQARSLIELVSGPNRGIDVKLLTAPRITLSNKQRAYVVVCRGEATLLPSLDKDGNTILADIPTGACLDIKPTIDPDYKSIACQLRAWSAEKASDGKTPIMVVQAETRADFRVPDKGAMLLRMERVKHVVDGARQVTDPNGVVKVEVRHKPVETSGQAKEYVYVLLQPEIVVNEAAETMEAGVPSLKSQPAPATQPADAAGQDQWPAPLDEKWLAGAWLLKASEPSRDGPSYCLIIMTPDHKWARASIWGDPAKPEKVELTDHGDKWEIERPDRLHQNSSPALTLWTWNDPADPNHRSGRYMGVVVRAGPTRLICEHFISITIRNSYTRCDKATWEALSKSLAGTAAPQFKTYPKPPATEWPGRPDESRLVGSWLSTGLGITPPALLIIRADHSWVRASVTGDPRKPSKVSVYSRGRRWSYSSDEQNFTDGLTLAEPLDSGSASTTRVAQLGPSKLRLGWQPYERLDAALAASLDKAVADNPAAQVATQPAKEALILLLDRAREAATKPTDQAADVTAWAEFLQRNDLTPQMRFYAYWTIGRRYSYNVDAQRGEKSDYEKAAAALKASLGVCGDFVTWETVNAAITYGSLAVDPNKDARRAAEAYNWLCSRTDAMLAYSADNTGATFADGMILGLEYFPGYRNRAADRTARLTFLRDRLAEGRAAMKAWITRWVASALAHGTSEKLQAVRVLLAELSDSVPAEDKAKWKAMLEAKPAAAGANPAPARPAASTQPAPPAPAKSKDEQAVAELAGRFVKAVMSDDRPAALSLTASMVEPGAAQPSAEKMFQRMWDKAPEYRKLYQSHADMLRAAKHCGVMGNMAFAAYASPASAEDVLAVAIMRQGDQWKVVDLAVAKLTDIRLSETVQVGSAVYVTGTAFCVSTATIQTSADGSISIPLPAPGLPIERLVVYRDGFPSQAVPRSAAMFLDLDTGGYKQFTSLPDYGTIRKAGVDIYYEQSAGGAKPHLATSGMQLQPLSKSTGWESDLKAVRHALMIGSPFALLASETRPLAFSTGEGGIGILQIVGVADDPTGVTIRYKFLQAATAAQLAWGKPADGFAIRLRPAEPLMRPDGWPGFLVDFRYAVKGKLEVVFAPESIRFEADGVWYRPMAIPTGEVPVFTMGPGEDHLGVPFWPATHCQWRSDAGDAMPAIKPGKHTFRLAFRRQPKGGTGGKPVEVVSQELEVDVPRPGAPTASAPATQPATEPTVPAHKPGTVGLGGVLRISVGDLFDKGKGTVVEREVSESGTIWLPVLDKPVKVSDANQQEIQGIIAKAYAAASMKDLPIAVTILRPAGTIRPLAAGDIITIDVYDAAAGMDILHQRQVQPDGTVEVPGLKDGIKAAGLTTEGFEKSLSRQLGKRAEVRVYISADLAPGDIIDVSVVGLFNEGLETVLRRQIRKDGTIDLPNIWDRARAAGMLPQALSKAISKLYDGKDAAVSVVTKNYKPARPLAPPADQLPLAPEDIIDVRVAGLVTENAGAVLRRQIGQDGTIDLPNIQKRVQAAGMLPQALAISISKLYGGKDVGVSVAASKEYEPAGANSAPTARPTSRPAPSTPSAKSGQDSSTPQATATRLTPVVTSADETRLASAMLAMLEKELAQTNAQLLLLRKAQASGNIQNTPAVRQVLEGDPTLRSLEAALLNMKARRPTMESKLGLDHPKYVEFTTNIENLEKERDARRKLVIEQTAQSLVASAEANKAVILERLKAAQAHPAEGRQAPQPASEAPAVTSVAPGNSAEAQEIQKRIRDLEEQVETEKRVHFKNDKHPDIIMRRELIAIAKQRLEKLNAAGAPATQPAAGPVEMDRLIEQLGGETSAQREAAQQALEAIGSAALLALRAASRDRNPERALRAGETAKAIDDARQARWCEELNRLEASNQATLKAGGRAAYIRRYRQFIGAHPECDRNLDLEQRIAQSYESDIPESNEARDPAKAAEVYLDITRRYDPNLPEIPKIKLLAADRMADPKPKESADLYRRITKEYPDNVPVRLTCYWSLGNIARNRGDRAEAEQYFSKVMKYDATGVRSSEALATISIQQHNSFVGLLALAARPGEPAAVQLAALTEMLEKYPAIGFMKLYPLDVGAQLLALRKEVEKGRSAKAGEAGEDASAKPAASADSGRAPATGSGPAPNGASTQPR